MIITLNKKSLTTENEDFWVAPDATVIGDVRMAKDSSIWFHCTVRGDNEPIIIGEGSNIQDNSVIHTDPGFGCTIGKFVTVGILNFFRVRFAVNFRTISFIDPPISSQDDAQLFEISTKTRTYL